MSDRCEAMTYDLVTTRMDQCDRPADHVASSDPEVRAHASGRVLRWYALDEVPEGVCADPRTGRTTVGATHHFSTNFTRCRTCGTPRPEGTLGQYV